MKGTFLVEQSQTATDTYIYEYFGRYLLKII